jgi:CheY-like chemotaxis protein
MAQRVVVIDDSEIAMSAAVAALMGAGYQSEGATDVAALHRLLEAPAAAIVVDLRMPEVFGDDLLEYLREGRKIGAKLVLYSELPESELVARSQSAGADAWVPKAGGPKALIAAVDSLLKDAAPGAGKRVLVVDDSAMTAEVLRQQLAAKGFEVSVAESVEKATKLILNRKTRPDLILLDVNMPNVDGAQFCKFIKGNSLFSGIKVLFCSGEEADKLKRLAKECGADGVVTKGSVLGKQLLEVLEPR